MSASPYTTGTGVMPVYLAGREVLIYEAETYLRSIQERYPQRSVIYYGLRGVGKTVLLKTIERTAGNMGILDTHIEVKDDKKFKTHLIGALNRLLHDIRLKAPAESFAKCAALIQSFMIIYDVERKSIGEGAVQDLDLSTGIFADDMTEIFVTLGKAALESGDTIVIFIDEAQELTEEEMNGVIVATHRCNQLRLPVMLFCAGLPKILKTVGEACSYSERLFRFEPVGALTESAARAAIVNPVKDFGVSYADDAVHHIVRITDGYPCFIQEYCSVLWNDPNKGETIDLSLVKSAESVFFNVLDHDFFAVRYSRCTNLERAFMTAMVKSESLPCAIADVAKRMNRKITQISPVQGRLINKGMIYPAGYAEIDFAVPQFDRFIKRTNPDLLIPL